MAAKNFDTRNGDHVGLECILKHSETAYKDHDHADRRGHSAHGMVEAFDAKGKKMTRAHRDLFKVACAKEGWLGKRSTQLLLGHQQRYFKIISAGSYLVYYDKAP
jgi:hypothetical protein